MAKRSSLTALIVAGLLALLAVYVTMPVAAPPRPAAELVGELSPIRYMRDVTYLASDEMKGRGDGSPELDKAADYIASQFRLWGLRPMGDNNGYFQYFEITTGAQVGPKTEARLNGINLKINEDFVPITFSNTAEFEG